MEHAPYERLKWRVLRYAGALPSEKRAQEMTDADYLYCLVHEMLDHEEARNMVLNSDFVLLHKQSPLDRMKWAELLNLSEQEEECIDESAEPGDGLLIAGNARVPIRGKFRSL